MSRPRALDRTELASRPLPPVEGGDKDSHGKILILAGSRDVPGAAILVAHGAMRAGAGKLQLAVPEEIAIPLGIAMPEAMVIGLPTARDGGFSVRAVNLLLERIEEADAIVAGPGMTANKAAERLADGLLEWGHPLALDAAMLHRLPTLDGEARKSSVPPILLPHSGEMASLLGCDEHDVEADPLGCGLTCADRYGAVVLMKGVQSHVVAPDGRSWRFAGGGPGLGVSGSGDVLAGIVGGLLARGADPLTALLWGVWLHGEAGRTLSAKVGPLGFFAREIPGEVPALLADASGRDSGARRLPA